MGHKIYSSGLPFDTSKLGKPVETEHRLDVNYAKRWDMCANLNVISLWGGGENLKTAPVLCLISKIGKPKIIGSVFVKKIFYLNYVKISLL